MRSVTSYFNPTLYRKNLTRFWPLWAAWTVLWLFLMPLNLLNEWRYRGSGGEENLYRFYRDCLNLNNAMNETALFLGAVYAVVIVMAVYGYLFNHRSAATMHALPMRRETLFLTNYLSGLTFFAAPAVLVYALSALVQFTTLPGELSAVTIPYLWQGFWVNMGCQLFFYSFAVFCAQFTGNVLALPAFYGILNVLVYTMYTLCSEMADQIFYGGWPIDMEPAWVKALTPAYGLSEAARWISVSWRDVWDTDLDIPVFPTMELRFAAPGTVAIYAAVGVALAVAALLLYRRRHIETAGDVVSVKIVRPIFRVGVTACAGLSGGIVMCAFFGWMNRESLMLASVVFCGAVGFFAAEMLLHKSFRVFRKSWKNALITVGILCLFVVGCLVDVFGVETWVPDTGKISDVYFYAGNTYPYDEASHSQLTITDPGQIERIVNLHEAILADYEEYGDAIYGDGLPYLRIDYRMENGKDYSKRYNNVNILRSEIDMPGTTSFLLNNFINDPAIKRRAYNMNQAEVGKVVSTALNSVVFPTGRLDSIECGVGAEEIWAAVQADFAAGNLGKRYLIEDDVRFAETYRTDLTLRFLVEPQGWMREEPYYYERYVGVEVYEVPVDTKESNYTWNLSLTVTLTPMAQRTLDALEKYYDLGGAYELATHD